METVSQNEIKNNIGKFIELVKNGEDVIIKSEPGNKKIAVIISFKKYSVSNLKEENKKDLRPLGILKGKSSFKIKKNFKISDEELLSL